MQALIISDKEYHTEKFSRLKQLINDYLQKKGMEVKETPIGRGDLAFCKGCFGCWVKKPGECVIRDEMAQINHDNINSDVTIYLSPVIFGQFSANLKNAVDRWLPNMLPFFEIRPDGSTMHPARYNAYPRMIIIGYGDELTPEDSQLFIDITAKHRRNLEVLVYRDDDAAIIHFLDRIELKKAGALL